MVEFLVLGSKQIVAAIHLRFMGAACEGTVTAVSPTQPELSVTNHPRQERCRLGHDKV